MRVVLWIGDESNQFALANRIALKHDIVGIVLEKKGKGNKAKHSITQYFDKAIVRVFFRFIPKAWFIMLEDYRNAYPALPNTKTHIVNNINHPSTKEFTASMEADLICVSGTYLVKKETLGTNSKYGIINLHTGLSPYVKGGPNCTNWCIANYEFHLIGNTIMWIDEGIDSGNLLLTEQTQFTGQESFLEVHKKVMDHGHNLYIRAIDKIKTGEAKNIQQSSIAEGKTYYTKDWTWREHWRLYKNFKRFSTFARKNTINPIVIS